MQLQSVSMDCVVVVIIIFRRRFYDLSQWKIICIFNKLCAVCNVPRAPKKNISHLCVSQSGVNKIGYSFVGSLLVFSLLCLFVGSSTKLHRQTWENVTLTKTAACTEKRDNCIQMLKQKAIDIVSEHKVYWRICKGPVSVFCCCLCYLEKSKNVAWENV